LSIDVKVEKRLEFISKMSHKASMRLCQWPVAFRPLRWTAALLCSFVMAAKLQAACQCPELSKDEQNDQASLVFNGEVADFEPEKASGYRWIHFDVNDHFKGSALDEVRLRDTLAGTDCAIDFKEKQSYAVYAQWQWGEDVTSRCMGTHLLEPEKEAHAIGPVDAEKDKMYDKLQIFCMGKAGTTCCLDSIKTMRANYYQPEPAEGCPDGFVPDQLRCMQSNRWCVPATEIPVRR
jgi:hypothetical protein